MSKKVLLTCKVKGADYKIVGTSIKINLKNNGENTVNVDDLEVYVNDERTYDFGENFVGTKFDEEDVADCLIRSYINHTTFDGYVLRACDEIFSAMKKVYKNAHHTLEGGTIVRTWFPLKYLGKDSLLVLQMIDSEGASYYSDGDNFILLRKDGSIATDMEIFYENAFYEAVEQGNLKYVNEVNKDIQKLSKRKSMI